jgi:hypothetical protein
MEKKNRKKWTNSKRHKEKLKEQIKREIEIKR